MRPITITVRRTAAVAVVALLRGSASRARDDQRERASSVAVRHRPSRRHPRHGGDDFANGLGGDDVLDGGSGDHELEGDGTSSGGGQTTTPGNDRLSARTATTC